ncbi:MAG: hypothetical protein ACC654_04115 [Acidimicrobiia bacterium]
MVLPDRSIDIYLVSRDITLQEQPTMLLKRPVALVALGGVLSLLVSIVLIEASRDWPKPTPIAGDPTLYGEIADSIISGGMPYVDVTVEHLPVLLVPILLVGLAARVLSSSYAALWPLVTIGVVVLTVLVAGRVDIVRDYQRRFAIAVLPMLPLIIYRLEIYVVLLAVLAIAAFSAKRYNSGSVWTFLGILAKGWPITLVGVPFRKGYRLASAGVIGLSVLILGAVSLMPGFQQGRSFEGIHTETIVGNVILVFRHLTGADLGLVGVAGATYVTAPVAAVVLNALLAVPILVIAIRYTFRTENVTRLVAIAGLATAGVIALSPLFSAQFMFWLTPFVVLLTSRSRTTYVVAAALSTAVAAFWNPFEAWWAFEVLLRNIVFVALIVLWIRETVNTTVDADTGAVLTEDVS